MERRLATILAADVVGYSRLMGEDEAGTGVLSWTRSQTKAGEPRELPRNEGRVE